MRGRDGVLSSLAERVALTGLSRAWATDGARRVGRSCLDGGRRWARDTDAGVGGSS